MIDFNINHCGEDISGGDRARHDKAKHARVARFDVGKETRNGKVVNLKCYL